MVYSLIEYIYAINKLMYIFYIIFIEFIYYNYSNFINKYSYQEPHHNRVNLLKNITKNLEKINIIYVKIFQSLCLNKSLLNKEENEFLIKYTDNVPYNNDDIDYEILNKLKTEFGIELDSIEVINSGIIGLVFNGSYKSKKAVIKVLKKNIKNRLESVFQELEIISKIINNIPFFCYICNINFEKILQDNKDIILAQTNFNKEVNNIELFKENYKNLPEYRIPEVYREITDKYNNIIVMENIKGLTYSDIANIDPNIKNEFGKLFIKFGLIGTLYNSAIHNDLHSGNIFFYINENNELPKYQIGIIDFGICSFPDRDNQNAYYIFFYDISYKRDYSKWDTIFKVIIEDKLLYEKMTLDPHTLIKGECIAIFNKCRDSDLDIKFIEELSIILKKYNMNFSKEFNQIIMGLHIINSLAKELCIDYTQQQQEVINELNQINRLIEI
tara:strand:+ start:137 stop:1465 length:1329 start_codon:yes stop_codon:yes gene_type:complete